MKKCTLKNLLSDIRLFMICIILVLVFQHNVGLQAAVPSGSMEPTVNTGSHILVNCITYKFNDPKVGEIIAFPHDTIDIRDGKVYVNDTLIDESAYLSDSIQTYERLFELPYTLSDNEYFVMGDNREISNDSRIWGTVDRRDILGKAEWVLFPFNDIHKLS